MLGPTESRGILHAKAEEIPPVPQLLELCDSQLCRHKFQFAFAVARAAVELDSVFVAELLDIREFSPRRFLAPFAITMNVENRCCQGITSDPCTRQ